MAAMITGFARPARRTAPRQPAATRVMLMLGSKGEVLDVKTLKSSGHRGPDRAVLSAHAHCSAAPLIKDGAAPPRVAPPQVP